MRSFSRPMPGPRGRHSHFCRSLAGRSVRRRLQPVVVGCVVFCLESRLQPGFSMQRIHPNAASKIQPHPFNDSSPKTMLLETRCFTSPFTDMTDAAAAITPPDKTDKKGPSGGRQQQGVKPAGRVRPSSSLRRGPIRSRSASARSVSHGTLTTIIFYHKRCQ